jgi:phosphoserine aminotransferase
MTRPFNFAPGPATLPPEVLQQAAAEMLDWNGSGMSVMEMSHRGAEFLSILEQARCDARELLGVPPEFHILFMQGGGLAENAIVPMNLLHRAHPDRAMDFAITGSWSTKSHKEAQRYGAVHVAASNQASRHTTLPAPSTWKLSARPAFVHICGNETVDGVEFQELPDLRALGCGAPLVVDCSSNIASRSVDWSRVGLAYAGAQKNIGAAGVTVVFVRDELLGHALPICPSAFNYKTVADNASMYNTPPTYAIYIAGLVFQWLKRQTHEALVGLPAIEARNVHKARLLYDCIDACPLYENKVDPACRSRMNVPFFLSDERLNDDFLAGAKAAGLLQLKGHKSVGGMRASLYNAMPVAGVQALVNYLQDFATRHG